MLQTTRRTVLSAAAWTVPVVTVATASPAFATSDPTMMQFAAGTTSVVTDGDFFGVEFSGASLNIGSQAMSGSATPTMTVTFSHTAGDDELFSDMTAPAGWWHHPRTVDVRNSLVFSYQTPVRAGDVVPITDGIYFGTDDIAQRGTFVLTFQVRDLVAVWSGSTS